MDLLRRASLVLLAAGVLGAATAAHAQLASPGELARPHQSLDGLGQCTRCHPAGKQLSAAVCLDCHVELKRRVEARRGLHGKMGETERSACQTCHRDHEGRDHKMIEWRPSRERFDHGRTGWALRGKHAAQRCEACHAPSKIVEEDALALLKKHAGKETFFGLTTRCATCHFDEHRKQVPDACESCHLEAAWKPAPKFDHRKTKYPLTGAHRRVACKECHPTLTDEDEHPPYPAPRAATYLKLDDIEHGPCTDCHDDPHTGRFGRRCDGCHVTEAWKTIKQTAQERGFHDKSRFPLKGMHETVACVSCHGPFVGRPAKFKGMQFAHCTDCHRDSHSGQLTDRQCERCHNVEGFRPAIYELEEHESSKFALKGAHGAVACDRCHPRSAAAVAPALRGRKRAARPKGPHELTPMSTVVLKLGNKADRCEGCHQDPHGGQFKDIQEGCVRCHGVESFVDVKFDHDRDSRFPLKGKHREAACASCHRRSRIGAREVVRYRQMDTACASCHADVHACQFAAAACDTCHVSDGFSRLLFDHGDRRFTSFALEGRHVKVACERCHPKVSVRMGGAAAEVRRYRPVPRECERCHADFHHGEFKGFTP